MKAEKGLEMYICGFERECSRKEGLMPVKRPIQDSLNRMSSKLRNSNEDRQKCGDVIKSWCNTQILFRLVRSSLTLQGGGAIPLTGGNVDTYCIISQYGLRAALSSLRPNRMAHRAKDPENYRLTIGAISGGCAQNK